MPAKSDQARAAMDKLREAQAAYDLALRELGQARRTAKAPDVPPEALAAIDTAKAALDAAEDRLREAGRALREARERSRTRE